MPDEQNPDTKEVQDTGGETADSQPVFTQADFDALKQQNEKLTQQNEKLFAERKADQAKAREAEEQAEKARLEKAEKDNDYKQLFESMKAENESLKAKIADRDAADEYRAISDKADKLAGSLTTDTQRKAVLKDIIEKRLKIHEGDIKITDDAGNLTVSTETDLTNQITASFPFLVDGSKASGGGALGGGGGAAVKPLSEMSATEEAQFANQNPEAYAQMIRG